jgi:hypothetical protein
VSVRGVIERLGDITGACADATYADRSSPSARSLLPGEVLETTNGGGRACPSAALRAGLRARLLRLCHWTPFAPCLKRAFGDTTAT